MWCDVLLAHSKAHEYFLKYDVGPTLASILLDMSDIYLTSYGNSEGSIKHQMAMLSETSSSDSHTTATATASTIVAIRATTSSLLGGASRCLIDCRRFVLTPVVLERHGRYMVEHGILTRLRQAVMQLIMKMLKAFTSICYTDVNGVGGGSISGKCDENSRESAISVLKTAYRGLLHSGNVDPNLENMSSVVGVICDSVDLLNTSTWLKSVL